MAHDKVDLGRRSFLKGIVLTATAATATGSGAAWLLNREQATSPTIAVLEGNPAGYTPPTPLPISHNNNDFLSQLASAQAENMRLQAQLDATLRDLQQLQQANGNTDQANQNLEQQLASANEQVGILTGLVALYEQLDAVDLGLVLGAGLQATEGVLRELVESVPGLEEGLANGQQALDNFEAQIPTLEEGRNWLTSQVTRLNELYETAEMVLKSVLESAGSFLAMLSQWFEEILGWLPFGVGEKAGRIMTALTNLLNETPITIAGLQGKVAEPLNGWLEGGENMALRQQLLKPVREQVLIPAGAITTTARTAQTTFQTQLAEPAQNQLLTRQMIRESLQQYRAQHQL